MKKGIERGQSITFRIPSDTPDYLLKQLSKLKETEKRNFSSTIASFVLKGVNETFAKEREVVTIPLPKRLTKEQKSWLKHEHSEAMIGTILYQLLSDPMRATTLLSSLNSNSSDINEVLSFEEASVTTEFETDSTKETETNREAAFEPELETKKLDEGLDDVDIDMLDVHAESEEAIEEEEEDDPLGDFFSSMNK
ncbi:hypothetical protein [Oceanobacillus senegalensis]|uniref:hypothetical protein n=1 Tax=Oceanobacillus senegalensis TaxID=1936063 RepID=UPI000A314340|nr:hypothetical protein [Oceanobacillus senegalensis]